MERVLPGFRVCLKSDCKTLNVAFERDFLSDEVLSHLSAISDPSSAGSYSWPGRLTRSSGPLRLLSKSVKRKIRYHVESLPAADNGFPGHDNPPVRAGRAGTEIFIKIYFWTGTRHRTLRFFSAHDPPILKK